MPTSRENEARKSFSTMNARIAATFLWDFWLPPGILQAHYRTPLGQNLYAFVGNDGVNRWDYLGMDPIAFGPTGPLSSPSPPTPSGGNFTNNFRWGLEPRDRSDWHEQVHSGHLGRAQAVATARVHLAVLRACETREQPVLDDPVVHRVRPDHDDSNQWVDLIPFVATPDDNGETRFGDTRQSPWEANAGGPGFYWFEVESIIVDWLEDERFTWSAVLVAKDELGVSPADRDESPDWWVDLAESLGARQAEIVTRGSWGISGAGSCRRCEFYYGH